MRLQLKYGDSLLDVELPERSLYTVLTPKALPKIEDLSGAVLNALREPVGSPTLKELVNANDRVAVIVSDITRPCPTRKILPSLLGGLKRIGVPYDRVSLIFATGIHRRQTVEEQKSIIGPEVFGKVKVYENDAWDASTHQNLGVTGRGTPASIDVRVASCDFMMAIAQHRPTLFCWLWWRSEVSSAWNSLR